MSKKHPTKSVSKLKTVKVEAPKVQPEETISTGKAVAHEAPATEVAAPKSEAPLSLQDQLEVKIVKVRLLGSLQNGQKVKALRIQLEEIQSPFL